MYATLLTCPSCQVLRLVLTVLFIGHLLTCAWFFVGRLCPDGWVHRLYPPDPARRWAVLYYIILYYILFR